MIREAKLEDMDAVVRMGIRFAEETEYGDKLIPDPVRVTRLAADLIAMERGAVFLAESDAGPTGIIALWVLEHPLSGEPIGQEIIWWTAPEANGIGSRSLLRVAENWARAKGAKSMLMATADPDRVGKLYERMSYTPYEQLYRRRL